ncbi:type IV secretion system protein VirB10 [Ideonella sp. A 288]|uniref:type IV secretion system protein VirB10 n=1 Tax=Ideonella sp. A 288 TaxID=1962181 RepID=UPI000B4ADBB6|nr:type IV secretion system protein VirB10 [Ideonella sp. A 288]
MTERPNDRTPEPESTPDSDPNAISPLPGEPGIPNVAVPKRASISMKGLLAVALATLALIAMAAYGLQRFATSSQTPGEPEESKLSRDRPTAATAEPRRLEVPAMPAAVAASAAMPTAPRIPALVPSADEVAEPIGVRRTGQGASISSGSKTMAPEDAPVLLVSTRPGAAIAQSPAATRKAEADALPEAIDPNDPMAATARNLQDYQHQLQGLLDSLTRSAAAASGQSAEPLASSAALGSQLLGGHAAGPHAASAPPSPAAGLFGGQLQGSATPRVAASMLGNRSLTLPKGTAFTCALKTRVISATSGLVGCQVQRNVFGDDGRVLLVERGSHLDGEYRIASVRPGMVRIPVLWTRIRTPQGVTVDIDSPATGALGESGIDGHVDNRWSERIGAAMLLSLIDDAVRLVIQNQATDTQADTIVLPSTTANTSKLAEKVLDSTINIPPLIYQNQGGIVGIYVARDVDFSSVYELRPTARSTSRSAAQGVPQ